MADRREAVKEANHNAKLAVARAVVAALQKLPEVEEAGIDDFDSDRSSYVLWLRIKFDGRWPEQVVKDFPFDYENRRKHPFMRVLVNKVRRCFKAVPDNGYEVTMKQRSMKRLYGYVCGAAKMCAGYASNIMWLDVNIYGWDYELGK